MPIHTPKFTISRADAATVLDVSTRTIDRYIRNKRLAARKKGGNILLNDEEIENLKVARFQNMHGASPKVEGRAHRHIDSKNTKTIVDADTGIVEEVSEDTTSEVASKELVAPNMREKVFEELYDLARRENREIHNKLEAASYKLGQIETQLKHSVPLLDYQEQSEQLREQEETVTKKVRYQGETINTLEHELKSEKLNKNIYIGLLFGLLALQPLLWLLLQS